MGMLENLDLLSAMCAQAEKVEGAHVAPTIDALRVVDAYAQWGGDTETRKAAEVLAEKMRATLPTTGMWDALLFDCAGRVADTLANMAEMDMMPEEVEELADILIERWKAATTTRKATRKGSTTTSTRKEGGQRPLGFKVRVVDRHGQEWGTTQRHDYNSLLDLARGHLKKAGDARASLLTRGHVEHTSMKEAILRVMNQEQTKATTVSTLGLTIEVA